MALSCPGCAKTYFISLSVAVVLFKDSFILVGHSCKFCGLVSAKNLNNTGYVVYRSSYLEEQHILLSQHSTPTQSVLVQCISLG